MRGGEAGNEEGGELLVGKKNNTCKYCKCCVNATSPVL